MRPNPGDVYEVAKSFTTFAGKNYERGMRLELCAETDDAPFGFKSNISNWVVKCPHYAPPAPESVWSSIWLLIEEGFLRPAVSATEGQS